MKPGCPAATMPAEEASGRELLPPVSSSRASCRMCQKRTLCETLPKGVRPGRGSRSGRSLRSGRQGLRTANRRRDKGPIGRQTVRSQVPSKKRRPARPRRTRSGRRGVTSTSPTCSSSSSFGTRPTWPRSSSCLTAAGRGVRTFDGHTGVVHSVAFSPDGKKLATGSFDKTARLRNVQSGRRENTLEGHSGWVYGVALSSDGRTVFPGGRRDGIRTHRAGDQRRRRSSSNGRCDAVVMCFSRDSSRIHVPESAVSAGFRGGLRPGSVFRAEQDRVQPGAVARGLRMAGHHFDG